MKRLPSTPRRGSCTETEDNGSTSGFYRFVPDTRGVLTHGALDMLKIDGLDNYDTRVGQTVGVALPVTLIFESPGAAVLDSPDNLAVSPQGAILLCEDGGGSHYMRGVTLDGEIFDFAVNLQTDHEWAGATFAEAPPSWNDTAIRGNNRPFGSRWDRVTLFVNRQGATSGANPPPAGNEGMTVAIWGPWQNGAL